jgi:tRNA nucleotidyltransferase (CCA-adding enzyme)
VARLAGRREIDIAAIEGTSIEQDLARRDFTVNAVAVGLAGKDWIDPFGGMGDLAALRLRAISLENLRDDPLRVLRAARLMATHELVPDAATTRWSARIAPLLPSAAPERIRSELEKLLGAARVRNALRWAAKTGVLAGAVGRDLSPAAAGRAARLEALDARALRARPSAERVLLRLAILARAMGMSGNQAEGWLRSRRFPRAQARDVAALLTLVDHARTASTDIEKWAWVRDAGGHAGASLRLAALLGEPGPAARSALAGRVRRARRPPRVTGEDVQAWLGIPPGPAVGAALEAIEVEGLRGALRTRSEARRWITGTR